MKTLLLFLAFFAVVPLFAKADGKPQKVTLAQLPPAVRKTVEEQVKGGKIRTIVKEVQDGKTVYEAELTVNGHSRDVLIDESGLALEVEEEVPVSTLPAAVRVTAEKAGKIVKAEMVTKNGKIAAYEIDVKTSGKTSEVKIAPDGSRIEK